MASREHVTVPIPRRRPEGPRSTQVPVEQGQSARTVVMPSVHNWVEQVYAAFRQTFPTGANELALLGVREMSRSEGRNHAPDTFSRNSRPAERGRQDKKGDSTTTFNDLLFLVWTDSTPARRTMARIYSCTIDPSVESAGSTGSPYLLEGKAYHTFPGQHHNQGTGLHIFTGQHGHIMVSREATKSVRVFRDIQSALVGPSSYGPKRWEFVGTEANDTFHVHWSFNYASTDHATRNWSAGCTVLMYAKTNPIYTDFVTRIRGAANSSQIPYLVVSSAYMQLPDAWATSAADDHRKLEDPAYTLRASGLVRAPAPLPGYLPSTMTYHFAEQVLHLADDVDHVKGAVQGGSPPSSVQQSLSNVLFHERNHQLPTSVAGKLHHWSTARGEVPDADRASLSGDLGGLGTALRNSIQRACFETVLPHTQGSH